MKQLSAGLLALALTAALNTPAHAAPNIRQINTGDNVSGEITSATSLNYSDGSRSQVYAIQLAAGQAVSLKVDGPLNGAISVFNRETLVTRAESDMRGNTRTTLRADQAGRYLVAVSGADARAYGPFRLSVEPIKAYSGDPLKADSRITDWLTRSEQSYVLQIDKAGLFTISMESNEFDTRLQLRGEGVDVENDDGGHNTNSRLSIPLQPGRYTLNASTFNDGTGAFDLSVEQTQLPEGLVTADGTELAQDGTASGYLSDDSPRSFVLNLSERRRIQIDASSREMDTMLELEGKDIKLTDDDSGGSNNPRISAVLDAGQYKVNVRSLMGNGGIFQLASSTTAAPDGAATRPELKVGRELSGHLHPGLRDLYTLDVPRKGRYTITMTASGSDLDGMLTLMRDGEEVAVQDDSDQGLDPVMEVELEPGRYVVMAHSFDPNANGAYRVQARRR